MEDCFEKVSFTTSDGFVIKGNLFKGGKEAVLLLHQFQLDKSSFSSLAKKLADNNITALTIDLRGHGESLEQNSLKRNFFSFNDADFRQMVLDVQAAKEFLQMEDFSLKGIAGSSIGANIALNFAAQSPVEKLVLLSPGLEFKGIEIGKNARLVDANTLIVASEEDGYSFGTGKKIVQEMPNATMKGLRGAGHGTGMFNATMLENEIVEFFKN